MANYTVSDNYGLGLGHRKMPDAESDLAQQMTKDPYNFDFLTLRECYDEKELKDAVLAKYALNSVNAPIGISEYELSDSNRCISNSPYQP